MNKKEKPVSIEAKSMSIITIILPTKSISPSNFITEFISHFQYHNTVLWQQRTEIIIALIE